MNSKIDWRNHFVAFLSALLGILIAFQLEDYKDSKREAEEIKIILKAIKKEIESNLSIYDSNVKSLSDWLEYFSWREQMNEKGVIKLEKDLYERMVKDAPTIFRFEGWLVIDEIGDSLLIKIPSGGFVYDVLPKSGISTNSWQAALNSGVINRLDYAKLSQLTNIYQWIEKDFGLDELAVYQDIMDDKGGSGHIENFIPIFEKTVRIQRAKYDKVIGIYKEIEW